MNAATPVPAPLGGEAELWPEAGVKVAVCVEHLSHCLRIGETGVSEGPAPDAPDEVLVRLDDPTILAPIRIPRSVLAAVGDELRDAATRVKDTNGGATLGTDAIEVGGAHDTGRYGSTSPAS